MTNSCFVELVKSFLPPGYPMIKLLKTLVKYNTRPNSKAYWVAYCNFTVRMQYVERAINSAVNELKRLPNCKYTAYDIVGKCVGEDAVQLYLKYKELQGREDLWKNLHEHMLKRCNS